MGPVNDILGFMKKAGATIIVVALILLMGISFSSQPVSEILAIMSGGGKIGSFDGKEIRPEVYGYAYDSCKNRYQIYGEVPEVFINQCASDTVRDLMVMPAVALDLGLDVSEKQIQDDVISQMKMQADLQNRTRLADDRLNLEQLIQREMARFPLSLRVRLARVGLFHENIAMGFPVSKAELTAIDRAGQSGLSLSVVTFTNTDLLNRFTVSATETEIAALYETEKKEAEIRAKKEKQEEPFQYPSLQDRHEFLTQKVIAEKKKKQLEELKSGLGQKSSTLSLADIAEKTGQSPQRLQVRLSDLSHIALNGGKTVNLTADRFLSDLIAGTDGLKGPYQDGETTIYLTVDGSRFAPAAKEIPADQIEDRGRQLAYSFANQIVRDYTKSGNFRLNLKTVGADESAPLP